MAFQDRAHPLEKRFSPGNRERKICWGSGGWGGRQHHQNPQLGLAGGGCMWKFLLSLLNSTEMCGANPSRGRKEGAEPQWRGRRAGRSGEPVRGHGVTEETLLLHAGFGSPKRLCVQSPLRVGAAGFDSRDCGWTGSGTVLCSVSGLLKQFSAHSVCTRTDPSTLELQLFLTSETLTVYSGKIFGFFRFHVLIHYFWP